MRAWLASDRPGDSIESVTPTGGLEPPEDPRPTN